jgi:hypothetical protein
MGQGKWGESFLKSGLPLEHLTQVTFRTLGWGCNPQIEYSRRNRDSQDAWFELDLIATCPEKNGDTELSFLVECKYHDLSRYWFFLPHDLEGRWRFNDRVLNCGPYPTLREPRADSILQLAPLSSGGIVVSEDGAKQDNAVYTAIQQLANGFVPCCLSRMFAYNIDYRNVLSPEDEADFTPDVEALIPMIVTNAMLYRLKPDVTDLDAIRNASAPGQVADQIEWTWCYHDVPMRLFDQNLEAANAHAKKVPELVYRFPTVENALYEFANRPNWICVVNIKALAHVIKQIVEHFLTLKTHTVENLVHQRPSRARNAR